MRVGIAYDAFTDYFERYYKNLNLIRINSDRIPEPDRYDLIIFSGGEDVDPSLYGQRIDGANGINSERDAIEAGVFRYWADGFFGDNCKLLGVCRGLQIISALKGHVLYQDLHTVGKRHTYQHEIKWEESNPFDFMKSVNSMHHQAINMSGRVGGAKVLAVEPKTGVVEALTFNSIFCVQFHPEFMPKDSGSKFFDTVNKWVRGDFNLYKKEELKDNYELHYGSDIVNSNSSSSIEERLATLIERSRVEREERERERRAMQREREILSGSTYDPRVSFTPVINENMWEEISPEPIEIYEDEEEEE